MPTNQRLNGHRPTGLLHLLDPALKLANHPEENNYNFDLYAALDSVVRLESKVPETAFSAQTLGTERDGSAVLINHDGILLTIGYLVLDANSIIIKAYGEEPIPAELVGYNHETGLALIHALRPLNKKPIENSKEDRIEEEMSVIVAPYGGEHHSICAEVVSRREFCGSWEYMIDNAIFTAPIHPNWSGAALINEAGKLCGIGSLWVNDAMEARSNDNNQDVAGNMFVPSNLLTPIYNDLISYGLASASTRPWLGMYTSEAADQLIVAGIVPDAPASKSDLEIGDLIKGINNHSTASLSEMYKKIWSLGVAGIDITINIIRDGLDLDVLIKTDNRYNYMDKRKEH